jgi:hypothetical protein
VRRAQETKANVLGFGRPADRGVTPPTEAVARLSAEELAERIAALLGDAATPPDGDQDVAADETGVSLREPAAHADADRRS